MASDQKIIIDFEKIKDPYSGLGQFCAHLKKQFDQSALSLIYWIPNKFEKIARSIPFILPYSKVFHAVHQDSPYLPRSKKTNYILTIHDLNALYESSDLNIQNKFKIGLQKKINRASAITFISQFTQSEVEKHFELDGKKAVVIYNGISLTDTSSKPLIAPDSKFLFSIGTVVPKKNFHVLVDFLMLLPVEYKIVLAGTTFHSYAAEIRRSIQSAGLEQRFFLVGTIDEKEKRWYYENASAFVFPSLLEGFGLPVAEAMALGLPLFLSDKTSLPEIGGSDAYYFTDFDATRMRDVFLAGMENFTSEKKSRLIERSRTFDWEKAANQYLDLYKSFL